MLISPKKNSQKKKHNCTVNNYKRWNTFFFVKVLRKTNMLSNTCACNV